MCVQSCCMVGFGRGNMGRVPGTIAAPQKPTPLASPFFWRPTERGKPRPQPSVVGYLVGSSTLPSSPDSQLWVAVFKASRLTGRALKPRSWNTFITRCTLAIVLVDDDAHSLILLLPFSPFPPHTHWFSSSHPSPFPPHTHRLSSSHPPLSLHTLTDSPPPILPFP